MSEALDLAEWRERIGVEVMLATTCTHVGEHFGDGAVCVTCFANTQRIGSIIEAEMAARDEKIADYENRIAWNTTCGQCAKVLDRSIKDYERAERAEAVIEQIRALHTYAMARTKEDCNRTDCCEEGCEITYCECCGEIVDEGDCTTLRLLSSLPSTGETNDGKH
jgi:hypothetical protein